MERKRIVPMERLMKDRETVFLGVLNGIIMSRRRESETMKIPAAGNPLLSWEQAGPAGST
jgi:hypothetical protein